MRSVRFGVANALSRWMARIVTILVPDNIPIWGDIQKLSEYHAVLG
jgi:hypothetical protein